MANTEKEYYLYYRGTDKKYQVSKEEAVRIQRLRQRRQYHGQCYCPKKEIPFCDGDCDICQHYSTGMLSLDCDNSNDGSGAVLYNAVLVEDGRMEDHFANCSLLNAVIKKFRELDKDADRIIAMWRKDYTLPDREIARRLGRNQRTFADQMARYRKEFRKIRDKQPSYQSGRRPPQTAQGTPHRPGHVKTHSKTDSQQRTNCDP